MAERTMHSLIMIRNDTKENWASVNPTLLKGEIGIEMDTKKFKVGNGSTAWNSLGYFGSSVVYGTLSNGVFSDHDADTDALYVDTTTKKIYRYSGSAYVVIGGGSNTLFVGQSGSTSATASSDNGNTYIHLYDSDNSNNQKVKLTGSGFIKVSNDGSNNITIQNTVTHSATGGSTNGANKLVQANASGVIDSSFLSFAGAISTVANNNLTAGKVLISDSNGKIAVASNANASVLNALLKDVALTDIETATSGTYYSLTDLLGQKVDKVNGKGLSTNDFTDALKTKLDGISTGANKVEASSTNGNIKIDGSETTVYELPLATSGARGGIKIGYTTDGQKYPVALSNEKAYVEVPWTNTTYSFTGGTNKFTVTPSGGTATDVTITPSITNNVIYTGSLTSGNLAKWNNTSGTLENGPAYGTTGNSVLVQTNSSGKISVDVLPDSVVGQLEYQGTWNATTPATLSSGPEKGWYFICSTAGGKNPSGGTGTSYAVGDWAVYNGTSWDKIDNTDAVTGVKGGAESSYRIGNVNITATNIGLGNVNNTSDADKPISTATQTALDAKVNTTDVLVIDCGHAGLLSTETGYESTYLGRWETIPTRS